MYALEVIFFEDKNKVKIAFHLILNKTVNITFMALELQKSQSRIKLAV